MDFFVRLFANDFMPHGHCYQWRPEILWLHVGSDALTAAAYFSIPLTLFVFVRRRQDVGFGFIFYSFAAFILLCGFSHSMAIYNVWNAAYRFEGVVKAAMALMSVATAVVIWRLIPDALRIPSIELLQRSNDELEKEVQRRTRAEEELKTLNARLEETVEERTRSRDFRDSLLDRCNDAVIVWDLSQENYVLWNGGAMGLFGYSLEEVAAPGAAFAGPGRRRFLGTEIPGGLSGLGADLETDSEWFGDVTCTHKDGSRIVASMRIQAIIGEGGERQLLILARDVTHRIEAEALLAHANDELNQFAHAAAHDLRAPIRTISTMLQVLKERHGASLDDEALTMMDMSIASADRMQMLILDLLGYAKSGEPAASERIDLGEVANEVLADLRLRVEESGATISVEDGLPEVNAPPAGVARVLQNLIENAMTYCEGPPIVRVTAERTDQWVKVSVRDNGIGIDPRYHSRVFDVFKRLHRESEYSGTGVGLATVKRVVESWGGSVSIESALGQGATFSFTIPAVVATG